MDKKYLSIEKKTQNLSLQIDKREVFPTITRRVRSP